MTKTLAAPCVGDRFGWLTLAGPGELRPTGKRRTTYYPWRCDCGAVVWRRAHEVRAARVANCGGHPDLRLKCGRPPLHGMARSKTWRCWVDMRYRCDRPTHKNYGRYGGRGIRYCERWTSFAAFLADMGEAPAGGTLGRIDNDCPYCPENCRWESRLVQGQNTCRTIWTTWQGERLCLTEAAKRAGIPPSTAIGRRRKGLPESEWLRR